MTALPRIRTGLLKHPLDKQVLVYDTTQDRVHLLDPTTACVLELLEESTWTLEGISDQIVARLDLVPNPGFLPLAIEELRNAGLLDQSTEIAEPLFDVKRRELLRNIAVTGVAALLIPAVASLTATRGYALGSIAHGNCNTCTTGADCISGNCCAGLCMANASCTGQADGNCCNANGQCTSNSCVGGFCQSALVANGGACANGTVCQSGKCCGSICRPASCLSAATPNNNCTTCGGSNGSTVPDAVCCSNLCQKNAPNCNCVAIVCN